MSTRAQPDLSVFRLRAESLVSPEELTARLQLGRPLRIKFGCDPSAPDLHVGHLVVLDRLRAFQELGHTIIFLVGDFTAKIGDPTGRSRTRPALSDEDVRRNAETYREQVGAVLDADRIEIRFNGEWMDVLSPADLIRLASRQPVARMLERDDFKRRHQSGVSILLHEFLYPLVQAYDSVALRADVEVGGTDQLFNLLLGREIQRAYGQEPQIVLTYPLLEGTDGVEKMSKSLGNAVGLRDPAPEMYGRIMSIPDSVLDRWIRLLGSERISEETASSRPARDRKAALARHLVARFHGTDLAAGAEDQFDRVFRRSLPPDEMPEVEIQATAQGLPLASVILEARLAATGSEAKRLVAQGGVSVDSERITDPQTSLLPGLYVLKVGKRRFARVRVMGGGTDGPS